jgi:hypothetical protein
MTDISGYTRVIQKVKIQHWWEGKGNHLRPSRSQPNFDPSDFHLLLHLMNHLAGQKFHEDEEVKNESHYMVACTGGGVL